MKRFQIGVVFLSMMLLSLLNGCVSVETTDVPANDLYSRKDTELMTSSASFGKGRNDDVYTALLYAYTDSELQSKYGTQFEIIPENVICYSSEGSTFFFSSFYKGTAVYGFKFKEGIYRIKLSKSYNAKWEVSSIEWVIDNKKTVDNTGDGSPVSNN